MANPTQAEADVIAALDRLNASYEVLSCDPELADTAVFCERYGYSMDQSANTIVIKSKSGGERRYVACVVLASTRLNVNTVVRKRLGVRRLSFASAEETRELTGMELGGVTPLNLPANLPLWIDSRVLQRDTIILGGGNRQSKIKVAPEFFQRSPNTEVIDELAGEIEDA